MPAIDLDTMTEEQRAEYRERTKQAERQLIAIDRLNTFLREAHSAVGRVEWEMVFGFRNWPIGTIARVEIEAELSGQKKSLYERATQVWQYYEAELKRLKEELDLDWWRPTWKEGWDVEEAIGVFARAAEDEQDEREHPYTPIEQRLARYIEAGQVLERSCRGLLVQVEREKARAADLSRKGPEGAPLIAGHDAGGRRHFLNGRAVHAGAGLRLLTRWGWLTGRYETSGYPDNDPLFYLRPIPGDDYHDVAMSIDSRMLFAWPDESDR